MDDPYFNLTCDVDVAWQWGLAISQRANRFGGATDSRLQLTANVVAFADVRYIIRACRIIYRWR